MANPLTEVPEFRRLAESYVRALPTLLDAAEDAERREELETLGAQVRHALDSG